MVPPHSSLECEFVCQPTFTSANTAQFMLGIEEEGESERECHASNVLSLVAQVVTHKYAQLVLYTLFKSSYFSRFINDFSPPYT